MIGFRARSVSAATWLFLAGFGMSLLTGCFSRADTPEECLKPQVYQKSRNAPLVSIPAGLDAPNDEDRLVIPEPSPLAEQRYHESPCLQMPPDYFERPVAEKDSPQ